jgi:hypothetical protein
VLEQFLAGDHPAGPGHQVLQDGELLRGEGKPGTRHRCLVPGAVQAQRAHGQHRGGAGGVPPQQRPDPGQQFGQSERLHQVVVRALVQSAYPIGQGAARGEHEHPQVALPGRLQLAVAQRPAQREPVAVRQIDVEQHQVVLVDGQPVVRLRRVGGDVHRVPGPGQPHPQAFGQVLLVLHHQQPHPSTIHG